MADEQLQIVVEVLAHLDQFKKALAEVEERIKKTTDTVAREHKQMIDKTNAEVRAANEKMRMSMDTTGKALKDKAGGMASQGMKAFAGQIAAAASIGLAVTAVDKVMAAINKRMVEGADETGVGMGWKIVESLQETMRGVPILGQGMDMVGNFFGASDFQGEQMKRAKLQDEALKKSRQRAKQQEVLNEIIRQENVERERTLQYSKQLAEDTRQMVADASAGARMIGDHRTEQEDSLRSARAKNIRLTMTGDDDRLKKFERQMELYELSLSFERRIQEARKDNRNLLADELTEHHDKLRALTEESHALEDQLRLQEDQKRLAEEQKGAEEELQKAREKAMGIASGAVSSFGTAGGSFATAASVGAMNEAKLANRISQQSRELLAQIAKNTADGGTSEVDLA